MYKSKISKVVKFNKETIKLDYVFENGLHEGVVKKT